MLDFISLKSEEKKGKGYTETHSLSPFFCGLEQFHDLFGESMPVHAARRSCPVTMQVLAASFAREHFGQHFALTRFTVHDLEMLLASHRPSSKILPGRCSFARPSYTSCVFFFCYYARPNYTWNTFFKKKKVRSQNLV